VSGKWWDESWNPVTGCTPISAGCDNCYAKGTAETRLRGKGGYPEDEPFRVTLHEDRIPKPLGWRKARRVFVNSMSDLFHDDVPTGVLGRVFGSIHSCQPMFKRPEHTFIICTKRPTRMQGWLTSWAEQIGFQSWPREYQHVHLGVTVENEHYLGRALTLATTPAAVRWLSLEPLLGPIGIEACVKDWVVVGCESGPKARKCKTEWVEDIVEQCQFSRTPVWVKQLNVGGKVTSDLSKFPEHLRLRQLPGGEA